MIDETEIERIQEYIKLLERVCELQDKIKNSGHRGIPYIPYDPPRYGRIVWRSNNIPRKIHTT